MNPPCGPCQIHNGYTFYGKHYPPTESIPPYTGRQWFTDDHGARIGECWHYEPMCAYHAHQATELFHANQTHVFPTVTEIERERVKQANRPPDPLTAWDGSPITE